jgi:RNA 3'-terminal phosphate cyclase
LSGNKSDVMDQIQPAVSSLTQQYEQGRVSENEFAPRGGGRTAADVSAPWEEEGQISTLVNNQENQNQTEGATGLLDINQLMESLATGSAEGASSTLASLTSSLNQQQQTSEQVSQSTGAGIGSLIALITS